MRTILKITICLLLLINKAHSVPTLNIDEKGANWSYSDTEHALGNSYSVHLFKGRSKPSLNPEIIKEIEKFNTSIEELMITDHSGMELYYRLFTNESSKETASKISNALKKKGIDNFIFKLKRNKPTYQKKQKNLEEIITELPNL